MAKNEPIETHSAGQLLAADLKNQVKHRVRGAIEALQNGADELHGLAAALEITPI